ncbi:PREDICTED: calmin [Crocodylus porosus]|uniref:calmin n=1 Tax=Crocodylus porosus TaxID=8502 RepID=UPI00093D9994|nr:PREDICTED: calmin [Crocodylus porosus]
MAGHEWDWFQREELIGQISDIRVQNLQVERENVQKRTFTRWINLHLGKRNPPLKVRDLFVDIQDGKILMALLEVLSGQKLMHEYKSSTHRIFRLNNIAKSLKFLEDSNVKLVSIDAAEIADGNSSLVLGLIWNIILFFQIKELTGNLNRNSSSSSLSSGPSGADSDTSYPSTPNVEKSMSVTVKDQRKTIRALLTWVQRKTRKYGVAVQDFASSWRSGLAFLAVIKAIDSTLVDIKQALEKSARENLEDAFSIAQNVLGVPRLLEPEDIMIESPDEQSIMTYVAQFLEHFPELEGEDFLDLEKELPIESTYVHIKDTPSEQEGKILILNENGEHACTVKHERSQPPPIKVCVHDLLEEIQPEIANEELNDKPDQPVLDNSQRAPEESSVLASGEVPQRPTSLPITDSVSFDPISSWDALSDKLNPHEDGTYNHALKQNNNLLDVQKNAADSFEDYSEQLARKANEAKTSPANKIKESCSFNLLSQTSDTLTTEPRKLKGDMEPQNETLLEENASKEEDTQHVLNLLSEEISTFQEAHEHSEQLPVLQGAQVIQHLSKDSNFKGQREISTSGKCGKPAPLLSKVPGNLDNRSEGGSEAKISPSSSKVSVIPHDLFYYPHYSVPISAVLEAFVEPCLDPNASKNHVSSELLNSLHENNEQDALKPGLQSNMDVSATEMDSEDMQKDKMGHHSCPEFSYENVEVTVVEKKIEVEEDGNESTSPQETSVPENPEFTVQQLDNISTTVMKPEKNSKRKEKKKNVVQAESFQTLKPGITPLLDKLEEIIDYQEFSRTSCNDSSVYLRKQMPNSTEKELVSQHEEKNTDSGESTDLVIRKKKDLEAKEPLETVGPPPNSVCVDQPELFYFIVFLWVLVYCLLLLPQLVSNKR